jgi:hypothetical protein
VLPQSVVDPSSSSSEGTGKDTHTLGRLYTVLTTNRSLALFLLYSLVFGLGASLFTSQFPILMREQYGLDATNTGSVHAFSAIIGVVFSAVVVPYLVTHLKISDVTLISVACAVYAACFPAISYAATLPQLLALLVPFAGASSILYTVASSVASKLVRGLCCASQAMCGVMWL